MPKKQKLKIIPLGGLNEIGKNMTVFEYGDDIIVVDCGIAFPDDDMPGVDLVIPDIAYLEKNKDKVRAFVITHGHEDHIGALPFVLKKINVPVYGTKLTIGLIEHKLKEHNHPFLVQAQSRQGRRYFKARQSIQRGDYPLEPLDCRVGCACDQIACRHGRAYGRLQD